MAELKDYPFINQLNSPTLDQRPDENKWFNCVICSILSAMLYRKSELRGKITPDSIKDAVLGEGFANQGTDARWFVKYVSQFGLKLYSMSDSSTIALAHTMIQENRPAIFTEIDPYVDTNLPQFSGWTHVSSFFKEIPGGLAAMDPFGGKLVEYSDALWASKLRSTELWTIDLVEETVRIDITTPGVDAFYEEVDTHHWKCKQTGHVLQYAILDFYKGYSNAGLCGITWLGLPKTDEIPIEKLSPAFAHWAGHGITVQFLECGVACYDPGHLVDQRPGTESAVYLLQLYNNGPGVDPGIAKQQAIIADLQNKLVQGQAINPQLLPDMQQIRAISGKY